MDQPVELELRPDALGRAVLHGPLGSLLVRSGAQAGLVARYDDGRVATPENGRALVRPFRRIDFDFGDDWTSNDPPLSVIAFTDASALLYERPRLADAPTASWRCIATTAGTSVTVGAGTVYELFTLESFASGQTGVERTIPALAFPSLRVTAARLSGTGTSDLILRWKEPRSSNQSTVGAWRSTAEGPLGSVTASASTPLVAYPPWGGSVAINNNSGGAQEWQAAAFVSTQPPIQ